MAVLYAGGTIQGVTTAFLQIVMDLEVGSEVQVDGMGEGLLKHKDMVGSQAPL